MMDYRLLQVRPERRDEALTTRGAPRRGYAHVHLMPDEHFYFDLRGLGRHQQKFRNWCKTAFDREYRIYFGGE